MLVCGNYGILPRWPRIFILGKRHRGWVFRNRPLHGRFRVSKGLLGRRWWSELTATLLLQRRGPLLSNRHDRRWSITNGRWRPQETWAARRSESLVIGFESCAPFHDFPGVVKEFMT